ncbi:hypothetical protein Cgig2_004300 [Carnegiea gigantea]|uniref:Uncharacterized protein n=1 Tax=Carnegiea gigantea TaxID=171969 RepID=A0A9Q1QAJ9_9CARY|nr:hypothetical protein Cgig2_004300 [Carnegiea gigantea]
MKSALVELQWSTFKEWVWYNRNNILRARHPETDIDQEECSRFGDASPPSGDDGEEGSWTLHERSLDHASKSFHRERNEFSRERVSALFYIIVFLDFFSTEQVADYMKETFNWHLRGAHELCPYFNLVVAEEVTQDFCIPEMIQAVFYAMLVNEAQELGVLSRDLAEHLKSCLEGLRWYMCEAWLQLDKLNLW